MKTTTNKDVLVLRFGMTFLLCFFALSRWFLRPQHTFAQGALDGFAGVMLGAAIGCIIWAITLKRRRIA